MVRKTNISEVSNKMSCYEVMYIQSINDKKNYDKITINHIINRYYFTN